MSSRVLKQQLSALTRHKGEDKELAPKKKQLKFRRKSTATKAKPASPGITEDKPEGKPPLSREERKKNLQRNLEYFAAAQASDHAESVQDKMQQVLQGGPAVAKKPGKQLPYDLSVLDAQL
ncbi:hypothetical protein WJX74_004426 [Apatococcus lobatus]|uniref:Active regulator of SIRT1 n=1 Tax=Apatococcus lobatus TaxID=904363 RepID=A0AAW1RVI6_9CHLO